MKQKQTHGGADRNAGRKSADGAQVKRHLVTLDAQTVERLKAADLGDEGQPPAPDLADGPAPHQQALGCRGPVHPPDLDGRIVPAAVEDIGLGDPV